MLTVSDVQALIVITLGDAFVLNRRVRQHLAHTERYVPGPLPDVDRGRAVPNGAWL